MKCKSLFFIGTSHTSSTQQPHMDSWCCTGQQGCRKSRWIGWNIEYQFHESMVFHLSCSLLYLQCLKCEGPWVGLQQTFVNLNQMPFTFWPSLNRWWVPYGTVIGFLLYLQLSLMEDHQSASTGFNVQNTFNFPALEGSVCSWTTRKLETGHRQNC